VPKIGRKVKIFSALEVANICGVVNQTAINWIKNGYLKAFTTPGGQYRIYAKDLAAFLDNRGMADSGDVLQVLLERANWGTLLIAADESLNNRLRDDLANSLPDFTFIQAYDGFELGLRLAGEKPGFLLLQHNLPGVNFKKLLQLLKEDPIFGKPYIFALGNFNTDEISVSGDGSPVDYIFPNPPNPESILKVIKDLEKQTEAIA